MLLNLLTFSAFVGLAAASYGNGNANTFAAAPHPAFFHHFGRHRHRSSSSSEERWHCARLGVFNVTEAALAAVTTAPKIAYYTRQGKEKAIVVCEGAQVQTLIGHSQNANVPSGITNDYKDVAVLSISTRSGLTFNCNKRNGRYEAFNLITRETIPIDAVACMGAPSPLFEQTLYTLGGALAFITTP